MIKAAAPNNKRIVIRGVGLVSPLGLGAWETFRALLAGRTITDRTTLMSDAVDPIGLVRSAGMVNVANIAAADPAIELAERAAREACTEAGVDMTDLPAILGTSKGAISTFAKHIQHNGCHTAASGGHTAAESSQPLSAEPPQPPAWATSLALGPTALLTNELTRRTRLRIDRHIVAACASSLAALDFARQDLLHPADPDDPPFRLVITSEAALLPLLIHSYRRLGVLPPLTPQDYRSAPLDESRASFVLTQLGAAVLLQRVDSDDANASRETELLDTALAADAHDLIRPDPAMASLRHIAARLAAHGPLAMLHPHAPGTRDHDPAELQVLTEVLAASAPLPLGEGLSEGRRGDGRTSPGDQQQSRLKTQLSRRTTSTNLKSQISNLKSTAVYAAKGALGHGLGAAGLTSLVLAHLMLRTGKRPPMPWLGQPLQTDNNRLRIDPEAGPCPVRGHHMILAAGFGGHVAGALIGRDIINPDQTLAER